MTLRTSPEFLLTLPHIFADLQFSQEPFLSCCSFAPLCDVGHGIRRELCAILAKRDGRLTTDRFMSRSVSPPILNVTILDEEASFGIVRDRVSVGKYRGNSHVWP
jgi:hypothetical protein